MHYAKRREFLEVAHNDSFRCFDERSKHRKGFGLYGAFFLAFKCVNKRVVRKESVQIIKKQDMSEIV